MVRLRFRDSMRERRSRPERSFATLGQNKRPRKKYPVAGRKEFMQTTIAVSEEQGLSLD